MEMEEEGVEVMRLGDGRVCRVRNLDGKGGGSRLKIEGGGAKSRWSWIGGGKDEVDGLV